jgi:hypothetical protein
MTHFVGCETRIALIGHGAIALWSFVLRAGCGRRTPLALRGRMEGGGGGLLPSTWHFFLPRLRRQPLHCSTASFSPFDFLQFKGNEMQRTQ